MYEVAASPSFLTGVFYNGVRYSRYSYYATDGRPQTSGLDGGIEASSFAWDQGDQGNIVTVTNAVGAPTDFYVVGSLVTYQSRTGVTGCPNALTLTHYDQYNHLQYSTDPAGNESQYFYNLIGQLIRSKQGTGTNETSHGYTWDASNHLLTDTRYPAGSPFFTYGQQSPSVEQTSYTYVPVGSPGANRIASINDVNQSSVGVANQSRLTTYSYTTQANGLLLSRTIDGPVQGSQDSITYQYNSTGDVILISNGLGQATTYGGYNGLGLPGYMIDANGHSTYYQYDSRGRLIYVNTVVGSVSSITGYLYNAHGQLTATSYSPARLVENRTYDAVGRLIKIDNGSYGDSTVFGYNLLRDHLKNPRICALDK